MRRRSAGVVHAKRLKSISVSSPSDSPSSSVMSASVPDHGFSSSAPVSTSRPARVNGLPSARIAPKRLLSPWRIVPGDALRTVREMRFQSAFSFPTPRKWMRAGLRPRRYAASASIDGLTGTLLVQGMAG